MLNAIKTLRTIVEVLLWIATLLGGIAASLDIVMIATAKQVSAPQQAGGAAMALAYVIIPYCMARAVRGLRG